ncbi:hypothetical protein [Lentzea flava]|uniref:PPE family protein n=1 Tax=Lentzea flava TaxID=103732 RepID=A0ABQ2VAM6_9PSEU|nr:hypothetical protein [Lentzea flava]MCP2203912.1 hypothetical protein [Lentzea flava]GGU72813.1 hypothetical protein GCM10010178_75440 [Lentzea flava]
MSLSGDFHSLRSVQEWLKRMRDESASVGVAYAKATPPSWTGPASTAFDEYRHRARMRWLDVSDSFGDASDAVETYLHTHAEVARLMEFGDPDQVERLRGQLAEEERVAVAAVDRAAEELWHVRSQLPEQAAVPVPPSPAAPQRTSPPAPPPQRSRGEDFMALPHVEVVLTTAAIAARYTRWQRQIG